MGTSLSRTARVMLVGISVVVVPLVGWWLGAAYGEHRADLARNATNADWTRRLAKDVFGISVGSPFPSFPVWSADTLGSGLDVRELLPHGGLLVSVSSSCHACVDVAVALDEARRMRGGNACAVALLLEGDSYQALNDALSERNIDFPVYRDIEQALIRVHNVKTNPTFFTLDESGVVHHLGAGMRTPEEFAALMSALQPIHGSIEQEGGESQ